MGKIERPWRLTDFEEARSGLRDRDELRAVDRHGMPMAYAAALDSATMAGLLIGLVDQVREGGGESALDRIEALLAEQVALLKVQNIRLGSLVELLSSRDRRGEVMRLRDLDEEGPPQD